MDTARHDRCCLCSDQIYMLEPSLQHRGWLTCQGCRETRHLYCHLRLFYPRSITKRQEYKRELVGKTFLCKDCVMCTDDKETFSYFLTSCFVQPVGSFFLSLFPSYLLSYFLSCFLCFFLSLSFFLLFF